MTTAVDIVLLRSFLQGRREDSNKYDYGHALLICGCEKMPGAAVLATGALRLRTRNAAFDPDCLHRCDDGFPFSDALP